METADENLQKPNIFNKYLPFYESIKRQGYDLFEEIRENLSRIIQLRELKPGFSHWSSKLQRFISLYGLYFTKADHIKLIRLYISVLSIDDLDFSHVKTCFDMLYDLMRFESIVPMPYSTRSFRKTRLITRNDLTIDWRQLYVWAKVILHNHDEPYSLVSMPRSVDESPFGSLALFIRICVAILRTRCSTAFAIAVRTSLRQQHRKFWTNFARSCARSIQHFRIRCVSSNCSYRCICRLACTIKDSSTCRHARQTEPSAMI